MVRSDRKRSQILPQSFVQIWSLDLSCLFAPNSQGTDCTDGSFKLASNQSSSCISCSVLLCGSSASEWSQNSLETQVLSVIPSSFSSRLCLVQQIPKILGNTQIFVSSWNIFKMQVRIFASNGIFPSTLYAIASKIRRMFCDSGDVYQCVLLWWQLHHNFSKKSSPFYVKYVPQNHRDSCHREFCNLYIGNFHWTL